MLSINWTLAGPWSDHVQALALTEHFGHDITEDCAYGRCPHGDNDGGRAVGLLQCHYPYIKTWYEGAGDFACAVDDTVADAQIKAAAAFLNHNVPLIQLDLTIQAQNLGVYAVMHEGKRNVDYLAKWTGFYQRIRGGG